MRISDWSSDVCSSDLREAPDGRIRARGRTCGQQACTRVRVSGCARLGRWRGDRSERRMAADIDGPAKARFGVPGLDDVLCGGLRSEEHTSELQSLMRISYAVFFLKKKIKQSP